MSFPSLVFLLCDKHWEAGATPDSGHSILTSNSTVASYRREKGLWGASPAAHLYQTLSWKESTIS